MAGKGDKRRQQEDAEKIRNNMDNIKWDSDKKVKPEKEKENGKEKD